MRKFLVPGETVFVVARSGNAWEPMAFYVIRDDDMANVTKEFADIIGGGTVAMENPRSLSADVSGIPRRSGHRRSADVVDVISEYVFGAPGMLLTRDL